MRVSTQRDCLPLVRLILYAEHNGTFSNKTPHSFIVNIPTARWLFSALLEIRFTIANSTIWRRILKGLSQDGGCTDYTIKSPRLSIDEGLSINTTVSQPDPFRWTVPLRGRKAFGFFYSLPAFLHGNCPQRTLAIFYVRILLFTYGITKKFQEIINPVRTYIQKKIFSLCWTQRHFFTDIEMDELSLNCRIKLC